MALRPPQGVCEAHLHQSHKPFVIGAISSQTNGDVWGGVLNLELGGK